MHIGRWSAASFALFILVGAGVASAQQTYPWIGPTTPPPPSASSRNVPAPLNVGSAHQYKAGSVGVTMLNVGGSAAPVFPLELTGSAMFNGSLILYGSNRYFNFGTNSGSNGYGIRDNVGVIEYKNNLGAWTSFAASGVWATNGIHIYNTNTGSVGIGITNPGAKLDVMGNIRANGTNPRLILEPSDANTARRILDVSGTGSATVWRFYKEIKGTDPTQVYMTISSDGDVGIANQSPNQRLDVTGNAEVSGSVGLRGSILGNSTVSIAGLTTFGSGDGNGLFNIVAGGYQPLTGGAYVYSSGTRGASRIWFGDGTMNFYVSNATVGTQDAAITWLEPMRFPTTGDVYVLNNMSIGKATAAFDLDVNGTVNATQYCIAGASCITAWPTGGTPGGMSGQFQYNNAGAFGGAAVYYVGTNVGIGAAAPAAKLDVSGDIHTSGNLLQENAKGLFAENSGGTSQQWMWPRWTDDVMYTNVGASGWNIRNNAGLASLVFLTNAGNVGIGTNAPAQKLDVSGGAIRQNMNSFYDIWIQSGASTAGSDSRNLAILGTNDSNGDQLFLNYNGEYGGGTIVGGNVGIGTMSPSQKLEVAGTILSNTSTGDPGVFIKKGDSNGTFGTSFALVNTGSAGSNRLAIGPSTGTGGLTGFSERLSILNNGYVGIGDSTPTSKLDVNGAITATGRIKSTQYAGSYGQVELVTHGLVSTGGGSVSNDMILQPPNGRSVRITDPSGGNANLFVNGTAWVTAGIFLNAAANPYLYSDAGTNDAVIRTNTSAAWKYFIFGADGSLRANSFVYNSDRRLKSAIRPLQNSLEKVLQLRSVGFTWASGSQEGEHDIGFIAQEVEKVVPEIVSTDASTTLKAIDYARITPLLVGSVQELNQRIEDQQKQIDELRAQIGALRED